MPAASTYTGGSGTGTVVFSEQLDDGVPLVNAHWWRRQGNTRRNVTSATYDVDGVTVHLTTEPHVADPGPNGWFYTGSPTGLVGANGLPVANFGPYV